MISVIIPTCDRPEAFLRAAIESVLVQTLPPTEVIVVDNGSRDADIAALPEEITLYRLPPRVGPSRARNFGAAVAKGTHLAFLDDDDWWDADFLREAWAVLQKEGTRCVYGRLDRFQNGKVDAYKCPTAEAIRIPTLLRRNPGTGGQNLLIDKFVFWRIGGFNERLLTSEDKTIPIECLLIEERISVAPNAVAIIRDHDGSRLSGNLLGRLRFLWAYRAHATPADIIWSVTKLIRQSIKDGWHFRARLFLKK